ncbi:glycoside hydrolase family 3 C-terminal domain-containing protein [uncultured Streptomyces sp.]|uniref:glycoside hydrolase family 3 C-terminal domain-containing protein n=1 Tax=uncultured Streptomyces sp. TaxID=174707 RepID=UPI00262A2867|nr:glycoside hydrolase family 3 C-terminal domain-containing protein [uncultured Streptomyces sp.]
MDVRRRSFLKLAGAVAVGATATAAAPAAAGAPAGVPRNRQAAVRAVAPPGSAQAVAKARRMVATLTLDEKIALLHGVGSTGNTTGYAGAVPANEARSIPALYLGDGPGGVGNRSTGVTQWPGSKALAATWDTATADAFGEAYGAEQAGKGHNVALAPCVNIVRVPQWGRSFETFTEDPFLNAELIVPVVQGIQRNHVVATVKHFAVNNQETERGRIDVVVSRRALEDLYLPGFRAAVQRGGAAAVMTAYNKVNGVYAQENRVLVQEVLRDAWGFDGMVMSDWGGTHSTVRTALAGSDMEMPGAVHLGARLKAAVEDGRVPLTTVDSMAVHVLTAMYRVGLFDHRLADPADVVEAVVSTDAHKALARTVAVRGSVLLKNDGGLLPFGAPESVAVIGHAADAGAQTSGGGSGVVTAHGPVVTALAGITARAGGRTAVTYAPGTQGIGPLPPVPAADFGPGLTVTYYASRDLTGPALGTETVPRPDWSTKPGLVAGETDGWSARYTGVLTVRSAGRHRFSLTASGATTLTVDGRQVLAYRTGAEVVQNGFVELGAGAHEFELTYRNPGGSFFGKDFGLHLGHQPHYDRLIAEAAAVAAKASVAVVVVSDLTSESMDRSSLALPADQDELITAVAAANPRTVVVLTTSGAVLMPWLDRVDAVLSLWYAGQEQGNALARVLFGDEEPGGRLPETFPATDRQGPAKTPAAYPGDGGQVYYEEELAVGYRWYRSSGEQPLFPFGHGLSYTTFALSGLRADRAGDGFRARVRVRNTGRRTGSEVVQLYVGFPAAAGRPAAELKAFAKVALGPGEERTVTLPLERETLTVWQDTERGRTVVPGLYSLAVGTSSENLPLRTAVTVE